MIGISVRNSKNILKILGATALLIAAIAGQAKELPNGEIYSFNLNNETVEEFMIRSVGANGYQVVFSEKAKSRENRLNGPLKGKLKNIVKDIASSNGLIYFFDGSTLYIYGAKEKQEVHSIFPSENIAKLELALKKINLDDSENYIDIDRSIGLVSIFGVASYVNRVQAIVEALGAQDNQIMTEFKYFSLKFAWATDRVFTVGGREVTIPGVASILRQAIGEDQNQGMQYTVYSDQAESARAESLRGQGLAAQGSQSKQIASTMKGKIVDLYRSSKSDSGQYEERSYQRQQQTVSATRVVANPHQNGIIIRDLPERMPLYESLIGELDQPTEIIEIEATIIDINTDKLNELGIEWRFGKDNFEALFAGANQKSNLSLTGLADDVQYLNQVPGFQIGAIIGNNNQFVTRLNMLEKQGFISVTSRPRVATLNDLDAVIESGESLYVPVEGAFDTDLFKVQSGTLLRVTPHVIEEKDHKRIRMLINVEDGKVSMVTDANGNSVPMSTKNSVVTQAIVSSGHSLLLGGLVREEVTTEQRKVPLLGDIPLLGRLFRSDSETNRKSERMYLISPRLISPEGANQEAEKVKQKAQTYSSVVPICKGDCGNDNTRKKLRIF